jgi:YVTN family beta-propeller protein
MRLGDLPVRAALCALLSPLPALGAERVLVLDREAATVTAVALPAATALGSATLQGKPGGFALTPDGARLLVFDQGPGKDKGDAGYQATGKSALTILDARTLKITARVELGSGLVGGDTPTALLSPDGSRLTLACPGYESKTRGESQPGELVSVDLKKGEPLGRVPLERPYFDLSSDRDVKSAVLFAPRKGKKEAARPAELLFVDLKGSRVTGRLELKGDPKPPFLSPDGGFLYLLDEGAPSDKPEKNIPGTVQVVSLATRSVIATHDVGTRPRARSVDETHKLVFFASDGAPARGLKAAEGELRGLRGGELLPPIELAPDPMFVRLAPSHDRLYVIAKLAVNVVELPSMKTHAIHLDKAKKGLALDADAGPAKELALSASGKRAFVLYEKSSKLLILDLESEETVAMVTTGRGGVKFAKLLGAAALTAASYYSAQHEAARSGGGLYYYDVYQVGAAQTAVAVRPDDRFVYVLNSQSGDVTVADARDGQVIDKIGGGGNGLRMFPGGKRLAVVGDNVLKLIDAETNKKGPELSTGRLVTVAPAPDGSAVVALAQDTLFCLDPATGDVKGRATGFKKAVQLLFPGGPGAKR